MDHQTNIEGNSVGAVKNRTLFVFLLLLALGMAACSSQNSTNLAAQAEADMVRNAANLTVARDSFRILQDTALLNGRVLIVQYLDGNPQAAAGQNVTNLNFLYYQKEQATWKLTSMLSKGWVRLPADVHVFAPPGESFRDGVRIYTAFWGRVIDPDIPQVELVFENSPKLQVPVVQGSYLYLRSGQDFLQAVRLLDSAGQVRAEQRVPPP
ncbi:MAG: hypothetical protein EXR62_05450 [Chloroflexi bacterium]|nr:hypothetical protein [Chloroflexota bacterium]